ncbi:hypothetical protein BRC85_10115 [Halobacteriales archaeon QS_1_69_70]|nr:MAG: hypothetical protein BRC85_10115 [Halobacteriales archaeon QS_1_69_70]
MLRPEDGCDRGQLLVIIALVLGMVFVALAIVVNAAIFTENLATRETVDSERTAAFTGDVERAIEVRYNRTNSNGSHTASAARATFNDTFRAWTDQRSNVSATEGGYYGANWTTHVGWRLNQSSDDSFAPADTRSATDWTVVEDTRNVSTLRFDITREHLYNGSNLGDIETEAFRLNVSDGSTDWELFVLNHSDDDRIVVFQGDPTDKSSYSDLVEDSCTDFADRAVIDFLTMMVNAQECPALAFEDDLSGPVTIRYENVNVSGDEQVKGTYTIVVNGTGVVAPYADGEPTKFNRSGEAPPTAAAVVYAVNYTTTYERADVEHHRDGRYAPRAELY